MYPPVVGIIFFVIIFSMISGLYTLRKFLILCNLKNKKLPILAHWFCSPDYSPFIQSYLKETRDRAFSIIILLWLFALLFLFGIVLAYQTPALMIVGLTLLSIFLCLLTCVFFQLRYKRGLKKKTEILIGQTNIYFCNTLLGLRKGTYFLLDVTFYETSSPYLVFKYGYPYTDSSFNYEIMIPVPRTQVALAKHIVNHYTLLLEER